MTRSFAVIVNECAAVAHSNPRAINFRATKNAAPNFTYSPDGLVSGLPRELTAVELDWLELIVSLFACDLACQRGAGDLDWGRDIQLHVPVRDPAHWAPHVVALQEIFSDLTSDRLRLHLHQEHDPLRAPRYGRQWADFDTVALFSGGVDSFTGAAMLLEQGRRPLLVSHGSGAWTTPQQRARQHLAFRYEAAADTRLTAHTTENFPDREDSQRARSLMFMGAASLLGAIADVQDVYINENGVMAVHVPLTAARIGSLSTKTAYPPIVEKVAAVASRSLSKPVRICNNLIAHTKPEVVATAVRLGVAGGLAETASCWTWWQQRRHCGVCIPCLMRRISFELHDVVEPAHAADPFTDAAAIARPFAHDNLAHLCQVVEEIADLNDLSFELEHPEILDGGSMIQPADARALYRRWAGQALDVLSGYPVPRLFLSQ